MPDKARTHIFVSGRVQGVFFREKTRKMAEKLGVFGWVRNLADGRVEAVLEGKKEKIDELITWAKSGSMFARVDGVEILTEEYQEEFYNFEVRYE